MNESNKKFRISMLVAIAGIGLTFFQDEIKCKMGLSCPPTPARMAPDLGSPETGEKEGRKSDFQKRVDEEIGKQRRLELEKEREDLEGRIKNLIYLADECNCSKEWNQGKACYLKGRLLSRVKFDREIEQMRLRVREINEILRLEGR